MSRQPLAVALVVGALFAVPARGEEGKDHPLLPRYPGSEPLGGSPGKTRDFDEVTLVLGKVKGDNQADKTQTVEGRVYDVAYRNPEGRSPIEVYRNYEQALTGAGFKSVYVCKDAGCGEGGNFNYNALRFLSPDYFRRLLVAKLVRPEGDVFVQVLVQAQTAMMAGTSQIEIVEAKAMQTGMVTADAAALGRDIGSTGHVALYGIYFDTAKAVVKPESEPTLKEVGKLLGNDSRLRLTVVGHTDAVGDLATNLELSRARARAVVEALTARHGVSAARLRSDGVGPLAPVATNRTADGRAKNRRVDLVDLGP